MSGDDCTADQLTRAGEFLELAGWPPDVGAAPMRRTDVIRLIAWYGALRYASALDRAAGSLESPAPLDPAVP